MATKKRRQSNGNAIFAFAVFVIVLLAVAAHYGKLEWPIPTPPTPNPSVIIPEPTKYKSLVVSIKQESISKSDAASLSGFYVALSKKIAEDGGQRLTNLEQVRAMYVESGKFCFENTPVYMAYSRLSPMIDNVIGTAAGSNVNDKGRWNEVQINATTSREISDAMLAIAWAVSR